MKKQFLVILFIGVLSQAQNDKTKPADFLFKKYNFESAAKIYLSIAEQNTNNPDFYVIKQLADCYYYTSKNTQAEIWYVKALQLKNDKESLYRYAQVLKLNGKTEESAQQMAKFKKEYPDDLRTKNYDTKIGTEKLQVTKLPVSSNYSDFGVCMVDSTIYFASSRNVSSKKYAWNNEPFLDIYKATLSGDDRDILATSVSDVNSVFNDGPATVTQDGKTMYFSSESNRLNNFETISKDKLKYSKNMLFRATNSNGTWQNIIPLTSINDVAYSTSNPCVSRDGTMLYFSSTRPGGYGGVDIWKVPLNELGLPVGEPENLGQTINTESNESFPFINDDNTKLYFSSNGRNGFGAYDVYVSDLTQNGEVKNMGSALNTKADDFAYSFYDSKKMGFLSSNRDGNDDIFMVISTCKKHVDLIVINDKTNKPVPSTAVTVFDKNKTVIHNLTTDDKGKLSFNIECNTKYEILTAKEDYENQMNPIPANTVEKMDLEVKLQPTNVTVTETEVVLSPIYFDFNKSDITPAAAAELDKLVKIMILNPNMVINARSHTDSRGDDVINMKLSNKRAESTVKYIISQGINSSRISGKGYGESEPKVKCEPCTEDQHGLNRRSEFIIVKK